MSDKVVELRPGSRAAAASAAVDSALFIHIDRLAVVNHEQGADAAKHEALGMHIAALAMIRSIVGVDGVDKVLDAAKAENDLRRRRNAEMALYVARLDGARS